MHACSGVHALAETAVTECGQLDTDGSCSHTWCVLSRERRKCHSPQETRDPICGRDRVVWYTCIEKATWHIHFETLCAHFLACRLCARPCKTLCVLLTQNSHSQSHKKKKAALKFRSSILYVCRISAANRLLCMHLHQKRGIIGEEPFR